MSHFHRNSQKRIYRQGARYFVTSVTFDRYPYFKNPLLAELFVQDLRFAAELKEFDLFGYTVQYDHVHLLFRPLGKASYSEIMRSLKTNFSRNANDIILNRIKRFDVDAAGDVTSHRLPRDSSVMNVGAPRHLQKQNDERDIPVDAARTQLHEDEPNPPRMYSQQEKFHRHYVNVVIPLYKRFFKQHPKDRHMPTFRWQRSFRDHYIRGHRDFLNHLQYIYHNAVKHGIVADPSQYLFMWIQGMPKPVVLD